MVWKAEFNLFLIAISFFTRIPVTRWVDFQEHYLNQAARYFPWVGWITGVLCAMALLLFSQIFPITLAVLLSTAFGILLTGAFHEDGFADTCDGMGGGWTKDQVLTIMKDSRLGTYGATGLFFMLGLKCTALASMPVEVAAMALVFGHVVSRYLSTTLLRTMTYVQDIDKSKSKPLATQLSDRSLVIATLSLAPLVVLLPALMPPLIPLLMPPHMPLQPSTMGGISSMGNLVLALLILGAGTRWLAAAYFRHRIGGYTGDCLGALQQVSEVAVYLVFLAWL